MSYPTRTADTMSDAMAMSSPSGRMSKRATKAAEQRLSRALFGPLGLQRPTQQQASEIERDLRQAHELRKWATLGVQPRKHLKEAERLEQKWGIQ